MTWTVRTADGTPAVLKLASPGELEATVWFSGRGAARVLGIDRPRGAVLLERVLPGTPLSALVPEAEEEADAAAARVMRALWRPACPEHTFPTVRDWGRSLEAGTRAAGLFA